ncbi:MAG TPA: HD domain-containing protein [Proteobacteria bacterium]|nr:cyclic di-GMP phosphodiesterase response regulator RpfG [bacterium BMS3Abin14]HDL52632.1 HD domain-containing protein [Pseudomonadota bacterium]
MGLDKSIVPGMKARAKSVLSTEGVPFLFSLRFKVALSFSLLLLLLSGVIAVSLVRYEWIFLSVESQKRAKSLAENLAVNATDPLLASDDLRLGPITESTLLNEDVRYAYLVNHQGRIVYHSTPGKTDSIIDLDHVPPPAAGIIQFVAPIVAEDVTIGKAVVGLGADYIYSAMKETLVGLLLPLFAVTVLGIVAIFFLAGVQARKIERLAKAVRAVGFGDFLVHVDARGRDEVGRLTRHFNEMVRQIQEARGETEKNFRETISSLAAAVEAKDAYTRGHCERVARISHAIAERMGMSSADQKDLDMAAILHDIGKIGVDGNIIGKAGPLKDGELFNMKRHPEIGARILSPMSSMKRAGFYIRYHHEHFDGTGYPDGLKGNDIPLPSRIINLVDAFDAMTSDRSYRSALGHEEAVGRLKSDSGAQFDPSVVDVFLSLEQEGVIGEICTEVKEKTD